MPLGGLLAKKIGGGIGLATEAYQHHKDKNRSTSGPSHPPPETSHGDGPSEDSDIEDDEGAWALDQVSHELAGPPPPYSEVNPGTGPGATQKIESERNLAAAFLARHSHTHTQQPTFPLPATVIIPQRRPREAQRGFVLAYPPLLQECAGIDQYTFLEFINTLNKTCEASQVFDIINLGGMVAGMTPSVIAQLVSKGVNLATTVGQEAQSRGQRNTFLDKINEGFFRPRGLGCAIVTWRPEVRQTRISGYNLLRPSSGEDSNSTSHLGQAHNMTNILSASSETTHGHIELTDCAPLIYPAIDAAALSTASVPPAANRSTLQSSQAFVADYLDRRRAAEFRGLHPNSAVATTAPSPSATAAATTTEFSSRWADPNHPANSGTLLGLLTGGTFDPRAQRRGQRAQRRAVQTGHAPLSEEQVQQARMGRLDRHGNVKDEMGVKAQVERRIGKERSGVRRMIKQDVCYLVIVSLQGMNDSA